jgi:hypothetical protein
VPEVYKEVGTQSHGNPYITSVQMLQFVAGRCACHPHKLQELTSTRHAHNYNELQRWSSAETYTTLEFLYVLGLLLPVVQIGLQNRVSGCILNGVA